MTRFGRFAEFFEENNGRLSSKRLAGLTAAWALDVALVAQSIAVLVVVWRHPNVPLASLDATLVITVGGVALGGLGLSTVEKHLKDKEVTRRASVAAHAVPEGS